MARPTPRSLKPQMEGKFGFGGLGFRRFKGVSLRLRGVSRVARVSLGFGLLCAPGS